MGGPAGVGGPSTVDWSRQVCEAPPPEEEVCSLPPEDLVCEAEPEATSTESHVAVGSHSEHTSDPHGVSFPGGHATPHGGAHDGGHGGAGDVLIPMDYAHRAIDITEGMMHGSQIAREGGWIATANQAASHASHAPTVGGGLAQAGSVALAPIAIAAGGYEIYHGFQNPDGAEGSYQVLSGTTSVVSGGGALVAAAAPAGSAAAGAGAVAAPVAAAAGTGLAIGHYGDKWSAEVSDDGRSISDRMADDGIAVHDAVSDALGGGTAADVAGHVAGVGTMAVELPARGVEAVGTFIGVGAAKLYLAIFD